jgi:hypothetical protein
MKIWKIIKIIHKIIVKSLDILNIFHIFVIRNKEVIWRRIVNITLDARVVVGAFGMQMDTR